MKDIVQRKYHQFIRGFQGKIAKPELKFISDFTFGFLRQKEVNHSGISRQLFEPIQPKKTEERLGYHLNKSGLFDRITKAYWERNKREIRKSIYLIYDESDIQKRYAEKMEGLQYVRDGSESSSEKLKTGLGYHWMNIIGVEGDGTLIPIYSDIYSIRKDEDFERSENTKIIKAFDNLLRYTSGEGIIVIDRGGDRRVLIEHFLHLPYYFIIRQVGNRHIYYKGKKQLVSRVARAIELKSSWKVQRKQRGKIITRTYEVGALRVGFEMSKSKELKELWLVKTKEKGVKKGYSYFLCSLPARTEEEAIELCMEGYGYRWKVEEFHRQVKQDYSLEKIRYQRYNRIHNFSALLLIAMGFLSKFQNEWLDYLLAFTRNTIPKHKPISYYLYRIAESIRMILMKVERLWKPPKFSKPPVFQLELPFG